MGVDLPDNEVPVIFLFGFSVFKENCRRNCVCALNSGDIHTHDLSRELGKTQFLFQVLDRKHCTVCFSQMCQLLLFDKVESIALGHCQEFCLITSLRGAKLVIKPGVEFLHGGRLKGQNDLVWQLISIGVVKLEKCFKYLIQGLTLSVNQRIAFLVYHRSTQNT